MYSFFGFIQFLLQASGFSLVFINLIRHYFLEVENDDKQIIAGIRKGDETAFRMLFENYYQRLVVFANKYLDDLEGSRDLVQEFFMNLYEAADSFSIHTSLKSYLYGSVRNRCLNFIKYVEVRQKHRESILRTEIENISSTEDSIDAMELEERIFNIVSNLPEQCRKIYLMSRGEGKSNKEIAADLELSIRTVETQISKALKVLREKLLPYI